MPTYKSYKYTTLHCISLLATEDKIADVRDLDVLGDSKSHQKMTKNEWATLVWNHVVVVHALISKDDWRHISAVYKSTEFLYRGCSAKQLLQSKW